MVTLSLIFLTAIISMGVIMVADNSEEKGKFKFKAVGAFITAALMIFSLGFPTFSFFSVIGNDVEVITEINNSDLGNNVCPMLYYDNAQEKHFVITLESWNIFNLMHKEYLSMGDAEQYMAQNEQI